jgi:hypothetical protein
LGYFLPSGPSWIEDSKETLAYDMADCWASCMIPFDWGLQFDPRGFIVISEMVSGIYIAQMDEDIREGFEFPPIYEVASTEEDEE